MKAFEVRLYSYIFINNYVCLRLFVCSTSQKLCAETKLDLK